jgi:hypothetical protein
MPMMLPTMAASHADGERRLGAVGERIPKGRERSGAAAGNRGDQHQSADHARDRNDLEAVARNEGDQQCQPEPE